MAGIGDLEALWRASPILGVLAGFVTILVILHRNGLLTVRTPDCDAHMAHEIDALKARVDRLEIANVEHIRAITRLAAIQDERRK